MSHPRPRPLTWVLLASSLLLGACAGAPPKEAPRPTAQARHSSRSPDRRSPRGRPAPPKVERGVASYYHDGLAGRPTASGTPYRPEADTCAHRTLRFGTRVEVRVVATGRTATCTVNDRGPFVKGRVIDVSRAVARRLGLLEQGLAEVEVRVLGRR